MLAYRDDYNHRCEVLRLMNVLISSGAISLVSVQIKTNVSTLMLEMKEIFGSLVSISTLIRLIARKILARILIIILANL
jgi:hypothetical protein